MSLQRVQPIIPTWRKEPFDDPGTMAFDPTRNIDRFYVVQVLPTLFGDWTVLREWGRRGSPGTMRLESYQRRNEAETAEQRTISAGCSTAIGKGTPLPDDGSLARDDQLYHRCRRAPCGARHRGERFAPSIASKRRPMAYLMGHQAKEVM